MKLTFHGAAGIVSGSCFLLETSTEKLLVDCGLFQGSKALNERNYGDFPFNPADIDAMLLTHAHIDHSGLLPKLVKHGFKGPIYTTLPTKDLLKIMLADSAHIQETEVARLNRRRSRRGEPLLTPIYTVQDVNQTNSQVETRDFGHDFHVSNETTVGFWPAGHMLGAASITVRHAPRGGGAPVSIVFSGDIGVDDQPLIANVGAVPPVEYVVMESTYGNRARDKDDDRYERLAHIIRTTFARGGNVIIPAFAVGRVQNLLYGLHRMIHAGELDPQNIFVDSPLAAKATDIFCNHVESFDEEARRFAAVVGDCPLYLRDLKITRTPEESMAINRIKSGAVVISSSGMADAGRIKHHLKHNLWRKESSVVFVSYQANGTLGRQLVDGKDVVRIHGEPVRVRAQIHQLEGFSAHADQQELLRWVGQFRPQPRHVYLVHGETEALTALKDKVNSVHGLDVSVPQLGDTVTLTPDHAQVVTRGTTPTDEHLSHRLWRALAQLTESIAELERAGDQSADDIEDVVEAIQRITQGIQRD